MDNNEEIPAGIYYSYNSANFYMYYCILTNTTNKGMGQEFYNKWIARKAEFPAPLGGNWN